jgi:hypothetical protein
MLLRGHVRGFEASICHAASHSGNSGTVATRGGTNGRTNKFSGPKSKSYKLPRGRFLDRQDLFKLFRSTVDLWAVQTYRGVIAGQLSVSFEARNASSGSRRDGCGWRCL